MIIYIGNIKNSNKKIKMKEFNKLSKNYSTKTSSSHYESDANNLSSITQITM